MGQNAEHGAWSGNPAAQYGLMLPVREAESPAPAQTRTPGLYETAGGTALVSVDLKRVMVLCEGTTTLEDVEEAMAILRDLGMTRVSFREHHDDGVTVVEAS